ncbi:hypothetical protein Droror1_Dr00020212 [Drosera rotundifolia]
MVSEAEQGCELGVRGEASSVFAELKFCCLELLLFSLLALEFSSIAFGYNIKTALLVGISLAQIGELAFVLLNRATNLHLVEGKVYLLLLGTTTLSLVTMSLLFKLIPAVIHL